MQTVPMLYSRRPMITYLLIGWLVASFFVWCANIAAAQDDLPPVRQLIAETLAPATPIEKITL